MPCSGMAPDSWKPLTTSWMNWGCRQPVQCMRRMERRRSRPMPCLQRCHRANRRIWSRFLVNPASPSLRSCLVCWTSNWPEGSNGSRVDVSSASTERARVTKQMAKTLVIVESPAKARTIQRFLDSSDFDIQASFGHVRDLPESADEIPEEIKKKKWGRLGVDTENDFKPYYVVPNDKRKHVQALKAALKGASEVFLATDPDREGESISWHLKEVLKPKVPVKRIVFHEITESAIRDAVKDADEVNENLVRAQESRRILDRLYGYTLSPVLWKKVQTGLSAGRVQSVAVRLIVDREEERLAFRAARYADLNARFTAEGRTFTGTLTRLGDVRVASGKDFDQKGVLTGKNVRLLSDTDASALADVINRNLPWSVTSVEAKPGVERPA